MTKIRKYNGVYKLPIKTHTPVRRPMSANWLAVESGTGTVGLVVQDISKGLENPLFTGAYEYAKPSLLTRVKERFKR